MIKTKILFLIFFLMVSVTFAAPQREESIVIRNCSSQNIILAKEYQDDPSKVFSALETGNWTQIVHGEKLSITDFFINENDIILRPNQILTILYYLPFGDIERYERLARIPFMDIMRGIYKTFKIVTDDGRDVINLENLDELVIKKNIPPDGIGVEYIIKIFDCDLEGRPALKW